MGLPIALIPSYRPKSALQLLVTELFASGAFQKIIVVDDGSQDAFRHIFNHLLSIGPIEILRHTHNLGKGAALKTGFQYALKILATNLDSSCHHIVCADGDGQHTSVDITRIAKASLESQGSAVLGSRCFGANTPFRNALGNKIIAKLFHWIGGRRIKDTQTGLRAIPVELLEQLLSIPNNRYDYEICQLLVMIRGGVPIREIDIATVYPPNRDTHFQPLRDSINICHALFSGAKDQNQC